MDHKWRPTEQLYQCLRCHLSVFAPMTQYEYIISCESFLAYSMALRLDPRAAEQSIVVYRIGDQNVIQAQYMFEVGDE